MYTYTLHYLPYEIHVDSRMTHMYDIGIHFKTLQYEIRIRIVFKMTYVDSRMTHVWHGYTLQYEIRTHASIWNTYTYWSAHTAIHLYILYLYILKYVHTLQYEIPIEIPIRFRPTQSIMHLALQVNRFQKIINYLSSSTNLENPLPGDLILQNLILRTRLCGTEFITRLCCRVSCLVDWVLDFVVEYDDIVVEYRHTHN